MPANGRKIMDHYNEQLVKKQTEASDIVKRVMIIIGTVLAVCVCVFAALVFRFMPLIVLVFGVLYLSWYLMTGTSVEYEYIVTNNDMDIDKIVGQRKRKRLITVRLNTVTEWGEYTEGKKLGADATVMASDATGTDAWYLMAKHEKFGNVTVIFTPTKETVVNINHGVPYAQRKKELVFEEKEEDEE